jgi:DNA polymerase-3 subunit epsilon
MMREICLDTETTGLDPFKGGHKIVEIACVEIINLVPTGKHLHLYINPQRDMPIEAFNVHGLSEEFLKQFPVFSDHCEQILDFIADSPLVIHNAKFDMKFINAELSWCKKPEISLTRTVDTLALARKKFPGSPATLDALCKRFKIDLSAREKHGALIDTQLLAEVYLELCGGKEPIFAFENKQKNDTIEFNKQEESKPIVSPRQKALPIRLKQEEIEAHNKHIKDLKNPNWLRSL